MSAKPKALSASTDFYCTEVLSGRTPVTKLIETENILAFYYTRPTYPVHIVVIPKRHIDSLIARQIVSGERLT